MPRFPESTIDVQTDTAARSALESLNASAEIAVDLEADAMHAFRARLCFLQISNAADVFLFDTLAPGVKASDLSALFADPTRVKYFHAAGGDLTFLAESGVRVKNLFDTHRAATLLGWPKVGLADLARELVGIELAKEHQQSDFSLRPLPPGMREYIADDVRYLVEIGHLVREAVEKADILEEVSLDCDRLCEEALGRPEVAPFRLKISGKQLSPTERVRAEAVGEALHRKRLAWAEAANVPMGRMLSNAAIGDIALKSPADLKALARCMGVRGPFVREHGEEVLALLAEFAQRAARGELVATPTAPRDPKARKREEALKTWRSAKAAERKVTPSVVLTNPLLETLAARPPSDLEGLARIPYLGPKRARLYGSELLALLTASA